jgi:D-tyrosyl-tRNA(Tyr) deacylase
MRVIVQRVSEASVKVENEIVGHIGQGLLVFLGISKTDTEKKADYLSEKVVSLRIFEDFEGKLNRSLLDVGGEMLVVSQFTLLGDCRKGRRPSFADAARPEQAFHLYEYFIRRAMLAGVAVQTGRFQTLMAVSLVNDGPVTLIIDSP